MTLLKKPISRKTRSEFVRYGPDKLPLIVTIEPLGPEDFVHVRLLRRRQGYRISVADLYSYLVKQTILCKQMAAMRERIGKRKTRRVKRK